MNNQQEARNDVVKSYEDAPTRTITAGGVNFAYRELGPKTGVPVIFLTHLAAVLDNWDPRVVDGIAAKHHVITFDNRGVGASTGSTPDTIQAMAKDAVTFIQAAARRGTRVMRRWLEHAVEQCDEAGAHLVNTVTIWGSDRTVCRWGAKGQS